MFKALRSVKRIIEDFGDVPHEIVQCRRHLRLYINGKGLSLSVRFNYI